MNTMWDHTRAITDLVTSLPSDGVCPMHGIENHICTMYTASDDRTIRMWNFARMNCIRAIASKA
jgi:WD40 repeat protein